MSYSEYQYTAPPAQAPGYDSTYSQGYDMSSYANDSQYSTGPTTPSAMAAPPTAATGHYEYSHYPAEQYTQSPPGAVNSSGYSQYNYSTDSTGYPTDPSTYDQYSYIADKVNYQAALPTPAPAPLPDQPNAYSAVSPTSSAVPAHDYGSYQYEQREFNQPTVYGQTDSSYSVPGYTQTSGGYDHAGPAVSTSQRPYSSSTGYGNTSYSGVSSESYNQTAGYSGAYYDANTSANSFERKDGFSDYSQNSGNYKQSTRSFTQPYYSHNRESSSYNCESEDPGRTASSGGFRDGGFGGNDFRTRSDGKGIVVSKGIEPAHRGARGGGSFPGGSARGRGGQIGGNFNGGRSSGNQYRQEEPVFSSSSRERSSSFDSRGSNSNFRNRSGDVSFNSRGRGSSFSSRSAGSSFSPRGRSSFSNRGGASSFSTRGTGNTFSSRGGSSSSTRGRGGNTFIDKGGANFNNRQESSSFDSRGGSNSFNVRGGRGSLSSRGGGGRGRGGASFIGGNAFSSNRGGAPPFGSRDGGVSSFRGMNVEEDSSHNQNEGVFSTTTAMTQKSFGNRGSSFGGRGSFNRGGSGAARIDSLGSVGKSQPASGDARNRINELKSKTVVSGTKVPGKAGPTGMSTPGGEKSKSQVSIHKPPQQKQVTKAPSRPQDKLLNEIEQKEKAKEEEEKKANEATQKAVEEENVKLLEEETKKKAKEAMVLAPPSKPPETAEEIAQEEEIQKKIRESIVVVLPEQELAMLSEDPSKDIEMPQELRDLLKDLTTDYVCKLCSVRIVGPQMGTMHYNGKNHLKKLRNFVQTNGRSAGFNLEKGDSDESEKAVKEKSENVEETEMDPKKYCKLCKITFLQENQSEMHYKGKNHAKKVRNQGVENGTEIFECKICCVTVTAQEHLTAHLNGARHKLQLRKMEGDNAHRGGLRGRGSFRGSRGTGFDEGDRRPFGEGGRGRGGFQGRGRGEFRGRGRGRGGGYDHGGFKRPSSEGGGNMGGNFGGPSFNKRPRFF